MIRMKALRSFGYGRVNEGPVSRGREFSVRDEQRARDLEAGGLASRVHVRVESPHKMELPPPEIKASREGPLPLVGGPIGVDNAPSSLLPDHPPPKRRSRRSRGVQES